MIDPYLDRDSVDLYLGDLNGAVAARVLTNQYAAQIAPVIRLLEKKHPGIEARKSTELHDRVFFIDGQHCWVIGQSIKDAADKKPTYLAPLPAEVVTLKLGFYESIWDGASRI